MRRNDGRDSQIRSENGERRCHPLFIITLVLKLVLVILSAVILALVNGFYESYMIAIIIGVCACTLLYVAVSVMMEFFIMCICPTGNDTCHVAEAICGFMFLCVWLLTCGISTQVSLSSGSRTTELFGWVGACTGIGTAIFLGIAVLYCLQIMSPIRYGKL